MASSLTREAIEKKLKSHNCIKSIGWVNEDEYGFSRTYRFKVRNVTYEIEWWSNISYLHCGEMLIPFEEMQITGTWPHRFKNDIQFYNKGHVCCILPIEE